MPSKHDQWVEKVSARTDTRQQDEERAEKSRKRQFRSMYLAQKKGGVTYRELSEITGLSEIRVAQILREERGKDVDS